MSGAGQRMPHYDLIQRAFGLHDVSTIQAFVDGPAREASEQMGAEAYAQGDRVAFKRQPDVHTAAHEAAHIVQQRSGRVPAGHVGTAGDAHERHADAVADAVVRGEDAAPLLAHHGGGANATASMAVQRVDGPLDNRTTEHTFNNTTSYETFEQEVRTYLSGEVRSHSTNEETGNAIHRERTLIPPGRLRNLWQDSDRGHSIELTFRFQSNGYSYRSVVIRRDMEPPAQREGNDRDTPQNRSTPDNRSVPREATPQEGVADEARHEIIVGLARTGAEDLVTGVLVGLGAGVLAELVAVVGAIETVIDIAQTLYELCEPSERDSAKGFGGAVMANRMAEYAFTQSDRHVWARAWQAIRRYENDSGHANQRTGQFMQAAINEAAERWTEVRGQLDEARNNHNDSDQQFHTKKELADYIVAHTPDIASVTYFMNQWHQAYTSRDIFSCP